MNTAVVNVKIPTATKRQAQLVAENMGLSLSALIHGFLRDLIRTRTVTFSAKEEPSEYLIQALKESEEDVKAGRVKSFNNPQDAVKYIDTLVAHDRKKHKN